MNARDDKDAVIFTGRGVTGAINHLVRAMRLWFGDLLCLGFPTPPSSSSYRMLHRPNREMPAEERPIVFVGPHEHHSNILPWRESICQVEIIPENPATGILDEAILEEKLKQYKARPMRIGCFSAASNVTGALVDTLKITKLLHDQGALSFWDYASAGTFNSSAEAGRGKFAHIACYSAPYTVIDVNPVVNSSGEDRNLYLKVPIHIFFFFEMF